ncbi:hypothetical protein BDF22DRAFT_739064 [Syncephalis plumigaleata]|nr:hypothetical protein BDF22DRAFT_739064 [Syncephalis plumigaleata]
MEARPCSTQGSLCPNGFSCYSQMNGFFCQPTNTTGCIITPEGGLSFVNTPLVEFGANCAHCPVPKSLNIRQQFLPKLSQIVSDDGWNTYGNCADGFCGASNLCRLNKESYSLCVNSNQCASGVDIIANVWVGRAIAIAGIMLLFLSLLALWMIRRKIRENELTMALIASPAAAKEAESPSNSYLIAVEEAQWLVRKLKLTAYFGVLLAIIIVAVGIVYSLLPPSAFPYDDTH